MIRAFLFTFSLMAGLQAETIRLSEDGRPLLPLATREDSLRPVAAELAAMLQRITGAEFTVLSNPGPRCILLSLSPDKVAITAREDYTIRSQKDRLLIQGSTPQAVEHAVWDLLHRIGFRQFFPGKNWEIVPRLPSLAVEIDAAESPDYHARKIWAGFGWLKEREEVCRQWSRRNRATHGILLNTGHAYDGILQRHEGEFARHPEYLALVDGRRRGPKFCIASSGLRQLVAADALQQMAKEPALDSISCDPSDGGGWCECADCAKIGSVSDRALLLANAVAQAVHARHPGRLVGMYAYNEHSPPPSLEAHPQVVISVATSFIRGGYSIDELIAGWQAKARTLGIREYYSVNTWDRDLPGAARGGNLDYLRRTIPQFHENGARFMSAESSDNFGPNGLGYYLAARLLWDVREARDLDGLVADFLEKAFGPARAPMGRFYSLLDGTKRQPLSDDLLGRMYRLLDESRQLTPDEAIRRRIDDLALYTRYCELFHDYSSAQGSQRQEACEQLFRFVWRIRHTGMVHVKGLWRDLPHRDKSIALPPLASFSDPDATNPWKSGEDFSAEDVGAFIREGIASRKLLDFTPVAFSTRLVPATPLKLPKVPRGSAGSYLRGVRHFWTWVDKEPATLHLTGQAGIIYRNLGMAKVALFPLAEAELKSVAHFEIPPDKTERPFTLATKFPGLHRIEVSDATQGTEITWPDGMPMTLISSQEQPSSLFGRWHLYFYVPEGTKIIGGFSEGTGILFDSGGKTARAFSAKPGYFSIRVPEGQDGSLWSIRQGSGSKYLMTVPPCLARDSDELLLPEEVVRKDTRP